MRSLLIIVAMLFFFSMGEARAQCPYEAPSDEIMLSTSCAGLIACPNSPITLTIEEDRGSCFPPSDCMGYQIQECDTVVWDLGDGTSRTVVGSPSVSHAYPVPGNYAISVTITNALGTVAVPLGAVVAADAPSQVAFVVPPPSSPFWCNECLVARETDGVVTVQLRRTLDLSREVSVDVGNKYGPQPTVPRFVQTLSFAPGEAQRSLTIPIQDDDTYYGRRRYFLDLSNFVGGLVPAPPGSGRGLTLIVLDDEPRPTLSFDASPIAVREGDAGRTYFSIPMKLSAPLQVETWVDALFRQQTATFPDFGPSRVLRIAAGDLEGELSGWIEGDRIVEGDETFLIELSTRNGGNDPLLEHQFVSVTIINDDIASSAVPIPTLDKTALALLAALVAAVALRSVR